MNIIYVSRACPIELYKELSNKTSPAATKFNYLMAKGLVENGQKVTCCFVDKFDSNVKAHSVEFESYVDSNEDLKFVVRKYNNHGGLFPLKGILNTIKTLWCLIRNEDTVLVCDYLFYIPSLLSVLIAKLSGKKSICICTDLAQNLNFSRTNNIKAKIFTCVGNFILNKFDYYVLLTKQMNRKLNKKASKCPFIVIEGLVDSTMSEYDNRKSLKKEKRIVMYAGSIHKIYGIQQLIQGFIQANLKDTELHIYGDGDFVEELKYICDKTDIIKYFGVVSNDKIIIEEIKANLLVNPRPTNQEYTEYSFPSKNMEYMVSGTPVLTTKLPGMPDEYLEYIYLIEQEDSVGIAQALKLVMLKNDEELEEKGAQAKKFVLNNKNEIQQSKKIISLFMKGYSNV